MMLGPKQGSPLFEPAFVDSTNVQSQDWKGKVQAVTKPFAPTSGEIKVSTSTIAALFSKMALTSERIAMVDMVLLVFSAFHI